VTEANDERYNHTNAAFHAPGYLSERFKGKHIENDNIWKKEWDTAWEIAALARANSELTPVIVDDVRVVLNKF